jgi:hypothetical protein
MRMAERKKVMMGCLVLLRGSFCACRFTRMIAGVWSAFDAYDDDDSELTSEASSEESSEEDYGGADSDGEL